MVVLLKSGGTMIYEYLLIDKRGSGEKYESSSLVNDILKIRADATKLSSSNKPENTGGSPYDKYYKVFKISDNDKEYLIGISDKVDINIEEDKKEILSLIFAYGIHYIQNK